MELSSFYKWVRVGWGYSSPKFFQTKDSVSAAVSIRMSVGRVPFWQLCKRAASATVPSWLTFRSMILIDLRYHLGGRIRQCQVGVLGEAVEFGAKIRSRAKRLLDAN